MHTDDGVPSSVNVDMLPTSAHTYPLLTIPCTSSLHTYGDIHPSIHLLTEFSYSNRQVSINPLINLLRGLLFFSFLSLCAPYLVGSLIHRCSTHTPTSPCSIQAYLLFFRSRLDWDQRSERIEMYALFTPLLFVLSSVLSSVLFLLSV